MNGIYLLGDNYLSTPGKSDSKKRKSVELLITSWYFFTSVRIPVDVACKKTIWSNTQCLFCNWDNRGWNIINAAWSTNEVYHLQTSHNFHSKHTNVVYVTDHIGDNILRAKLFIWNIDNVSTIYIIPLHDTGSWNPSSCKTIIYLFHVLDIMDADILATRGAWASATMIFTWFDRGNSFPAR